jgi:hypothetical protein
MKDDADLLRAKPLPTKSGQRRYYGGKSEDSDGGKADDQQRVASLGGFMRNLDPGLVLITLALSCAACGESSTFLTAFRTEEQAQTHCPKDIVVWLDPQSGLYYFKGHGSYGRSNAGRYACRTEADAAGMHGMPN